MSDENLSDQFQQKCIVSVDNAIGLSFLTAHSNLVSVCQKHKLTRKEVKACIDEDIIQVLDEKIPINAKQGTGKYWNEVKLNMQNILKPKLLENQKVSLLLAVVNNMDGFLDAISNEIVRQLENKYRNQGMFHYVANRTLTEEFHYAEKFGTTDRDKGQAEYLLITGSGQIQCGQKAMGANEVSLNIKLQIRAVTIKFDEIEWCHELPEGTRQAMLNELKWNNVKTLT